MTKKIKTKIPVYQWTHEGDEVLILRFSDQDGRSYHGFQHPMNIGDAVVEPNWNAQPVCGGGIHGWAWGIGLGEGKSPEWRDGLWQVYGALPQNVVGEVDAGQKVKFETGVLRFKGDWHAAMMFILDGQKAWVEQFADGNGHATGYRSASSATGDRSASSATGYRSASSATGDSSASSATGDRSASSATGKASTAVVTGSDGKGMAGEYGCIALAFWNADKKRYEMRCAETSDEAGTGGKLKANVWYRLDDKTGEFIESSN